MKRPRSDLRLSWRDPAMPVLRDYRMGDGSVRTVVDPDYERRYREFLMQTTTLPDYRSDPTYNLKRTPRK
jgi:hypothetical protein